MAESKTLAGAKPAEQTIDAIPALKKQEKALCEFSRVAEIVFLFVFACEGVQAIDKAACSAPGIPLGVGAALQVRCPDESNSSDMKHLSSFAKMSLPCLTLVQVASSAGV